MSSQSEVGRFSSKYYATCSPERHVFLSLLDPSLTYLPIRISQARSEQQSAFARSPPPYPYAPLITPSDAHVDFRQLSAMDVRRLHAAIAHQRPLYTLIPDGKTTVQLSELSSPSAQDLPANVFPPGATPGTAVLHAQSGSVLVLCKDGDVVAVERLKIESKKEVGAKDFWNGLREGWVSVVERNDGKWRICCLGGDESVGGA
jgi:methionyl-tRNA formyltransferase